MTGSIKGDKPVDKGVPESGQVGSKRSASTAFGMRLFKRKKTDSEKQKTDYSNKLKSLSEDMNNLKARLENSKFFNQQIKMVVARQMTKLNDEVIKISELIAKYNEISPEEQSQIGDQFENALAMLRSSQKTCDEDIESMMRWETSWSMPIDKAEKGKQPPTLHSDWELKARGNIDTTIHPLQYEKDVDRQKMIIGGIEFRKKQDEPNIDFCTRIGDALLDLLAPSSFLTEQAVSVRGKEMQLLRYEIESVSNQILSSYSNEAYAKCQEKYRGPNPEEPKSFMSNLQNAQILECDFDPVTNIITVSRLDCYEIVSFEEGRKSEGYDAIRTTLTIDLNRIDKNKLLETPGACSIQTYVSGLRGTIGEIDRRLEDRSKEQKENA